MLKLKSISAQAVVLVVTMCLSCSLVLVGLGHLALRNDARDDLALTATNARERAVDVLAKISQRVETYAAIYAAHPDIVDAARRDDKARQKEVLVRLFRQVHERDKVVASMEITDSDGIVLMRGHRPESFGDSKGKEALVRSALSATPARGLSVSPTSGEVASDAVYPLKDGGRIIGTLKIGSYFRADTAAEIKRLSGADVALFYQGKVNASTIANFKAPDLSGQDLGGTGASFAMAVDGVSYQSAARALATVGGESLVVLSLTESEPVYAKLGRFERDLALKGLLCLLLIVAIVISVVRRGVRSLGDLTGSMGELAGGNLDVAIPHVGRADEIGAMAAAVMVFRDNGRQMRNLEEQEKRSAAERLARAEQVTAIVEDVRLVVEQAAMGDFSARLVCENASDELRRLVDGINKINSAVDSATEEFSGILGAVARGDLTQAITTGYQGRFNDLKDAINQTVVQLAQTVQSIKTTAAEVGVSVREISGGARDLSLRTEQQASSLEETAATTEELAASVKISAAALQQTVTLAAEATSIAEQGGDIATQAVGAMARIESSSSKISDITSVIDEIAFQTNLLALNAAVEAARAGDAGKGFAVVASEVRVLAQRSSQAARDIKSLIVASEAEVSDGVKLVQSAGTALGQIVAAAHKLSATIAEASTASGAQAAGIHEMSQTVAGMDDITQQNAALAEESAASAAGLATQIELLNQIVGSFRTRSAVGAREAEARNLQDLVSRSVAESGPGTGQTWRRTGSTSLRG